MKLLLIFLLLPNCLFAQTQTGSLDLLTGVWVNEQETDNITRINVRRDGTRTLVHAWGACSPNDCDWGETEAELWKGIPTAVWNQGFVTVRMQLIPVATGRIIVASESEFHDESGRNVPAQAEFFQRLEAKPDSEEALRARALLRQASEAYRNLSFAYFEAVSTSTRTLAQSEVRTVTHEKIFLAPPNKARTEYDSSGASHISIDDGVSEWTVYPQANEYQVQPQGNGRIGNGPISPYTFLGEVRGDPKIVGPAMVQDAQCTEVRIAMDHGVSEQVWIEDATRLVRKTKIDEGKSRSETLFSTVRLGEATPSSMFTYDPSATNAKNRITLSHEASQTLTGKAAPEFSLHDLNGSTIDLAALRGKPVLLDFWATWCGYCREALPSIEMLHRGLKDKLAVYGIDNEEPEVAREYLQKYGYTLSSLVDPKDEAVNLYHINGWPTTVLIDRDGKVVLYQEDFEPEKLRDALTRLDVW
jgi:thiol-disulfide isomerase/thioredoxin